MQIEETVYPTLYKKSSTGKLLEWTIKAKGDKYWAEYGQIGGTIRKDSPTTVTAKNVGKSNETSVQEQAKKEAQAKWDKKVKGAYFEDITKVDNKPFQVTLAHTAQEHLAKLLGKNCLLQPKLDGIRCYITKDGAFSRENNQFISTRYIEEELSDFFEQYPNAKLDGELYNHFFKDDFNAIVSLVKKETEPTKEEWKRINKYLQFHIYDVTELGYTKYEVYADRFLRLFDILEETDKITIVDFAGIDELDDPFTEGSMSEQYFKQCLRQGYEGMMIRYSDMLYENKRSYNLLKVKEFITEEFKIVGMIEGKGNRSGMLGKFILELPNGETFKANSRGNFEYYKEIWDNQKDYIGKMATHRFMNYTPKGVPRGGAVIAVRDYE